MKRSAPLKRTPFKSRQPQHQPAVEREPRPMARLLAKPNYSGATAAAVPKTKAQRNRALLDMAQGRHCLLRVDGVCTGDTVTTVACHSNLAEHGKGGARKADDCYSVWGCMACHRWLDQGAALAVRKERVFRLALLSQIAEWHRVAHNALEPERFRKAAVWALERVKDEK